jgi:hypothetical protein
MRSNRLPSLKCCSGAGVQDMKRAAFVVIAVLALLGAAGAAKAEGNPFEKLSGNWTGEGRVRTSDGSFKKVTCKADYKTASNNLTLNLGCTGDDYEIEAKLKLADKDGRVKGTWNEVVYDASGSVTGRAHEDVIRAVIRGDKFSGRMSIKTTDAGHSINILQLNEDTGVYRLATSLVFQRK